MIQIQDVVVPTKGTGKYLNVMAQNFNISPENGISLYWQVFAEGSRTNPETEEVETYPSSVLLEGNLHMPQETYDAWGTDDSHVTDWAITELGFTAVTSEE